jgi:alpha-tubulin suppressor-like RCC1 family protein
MRHGRLTRPIRVLATVALSALGLTAVSFAGPPSVSPVNPAINPGQTEQFVAVSGSPMPLQETREVVNGSFHTCALLLDGTVRCWGHNGVGQLGNGTTTDSDVPVMVSGLSGAASIAAGQNHTCAVLVNGTVECWGYNYAGQLGNGTTNSLSSPATVMGLTVPAVGITAGQNHTCAVLVDGTVECWGWNIFGQLGNSNTHNALTPVAVAGFAGVKAVAAGYNHTCALQLGNGSTSAVYCWGYNSSGQLGNNTTTNSSAPAQSWVDAAAAISAAGDHTCALLAYGGQVYCWGDTAGSITPNQVGGLGEAKAIASGAVHDCALLAVGSLQCWGYNWYGQLGNGSTNNSINTPVKVSGLSGASGLSAGGYETCASLANGTLDCWGYNAFGQLGNGNTTNSTTPVTVTGNLLPGAGIRQVANGSAHTCALLGDGTVQCWGSNRFGQLGNGTNITPLNPGIVVNLTGAIAIAAGAGHTCALLAGGTLECWGDNTYGETGNGCANIMCYQPLPVGNVSGAVAIAAGGFHTCALLVDGTVDCWGENDWGQAGNGTVGQFGGAFPVKGLNQVVAITTGFSDTCALYPNGYAACWGRNTSGELGSTGVHLTPAIVSGLTSAISISAGNQATCAVLSSGSAECWGYNASGQLGNGGTASSSTPVPVSNLSRVKAIAVGDSTACAVIAGGYLECWGYNAEGQLGDNSTSNSHVPVGVTGPNGVWLTGVATTSVGAYTASALISNGSVEDWGGLSGYGQLGNGTWGSSTTPVLVPSLLLPTVKWTSNSSNVATIDPVTGLATAVGAGTTTIQVTYSGQSATTTLTVY